MATNAPIRIALCLVWLTAVGAGLAFMSNYQNSAGKTGQAPSQWPAEARIARAPDRATLLLFAHPKCPCTRATMGELNRLLTRCPQGMDTHVFFLKPEHAAADWGQTDLRRSAAALPGITVEDDPEGQLAHQFGAETSGSVLLYDRQGQLLFKGGITAGRGHAGDNIGSDMIVSLLAGKDNSLRQTPVYGCSLLNECAATPTKETICSK
jgi:hypothetical protein